MAVQAGIRKRHITTVAITAVCRNVTHSANLHGYHIRDEHVTSLQLHVKFVKVKADISEEAEPRQRAVESP